MFPKILDIVSAVGVGHFGCSHFHLISVVWGLGFVPVVLETLRNRRILYFVVLALESDGAQIIHVRGRI